jgi:hypothetical protein
MSRAVSDTHDCIVEDKEALAVLGSLIDTVKEALNAGNDIAHAFFLESSLKEIVNSVAPRV